MDRTHFPHVGDDTREHASRPHETFHRIGTDPFAATG